MPNLKVPIAAILQSPDLQQLGALAMLLGVHDRSSDDTYSYMNGITNITLFDIAKVKGIIAAGGEVTDYPVFFQFTPTAYAKEVPAFMPNREVVAEDETVTIKKWSEYGADNQHHVEIDGKHYISSNPFGKSIPASIWTQLDSLAGVTVLSVQEYKDLQPTSEELV